MTATFTNALNVIWARLPESRVQLRIGGMHVISTCISSGLNVTKENTDLGLIDMPTGSVRFKYEDERPDARFMPADVIEFLPNGQTVWIKARIKDRKLSGGVVTLELSAENE